MSYIMKTNLSRKENYGGKRSLSNIKYIVIHFTANDGDHDESNAAYFHNKVTKTSAHYFVDDDSITQSVPDNYVAYSVGGKKYTDCSRTGGGKLYRVVTNSNSINIELCDAKKDGKYAATEATMNNAVELVKILMNKYNVDINHVVRHFDVNGKHCPVYFMDSAAWSSFKARITGAPKTSTTGSADGNGAFKPYVVKITATNLNIRYGPGTDYKISGVIKPGSYTIVAESAGKGSAKGWGKLKSGAGWISLGYATKV